MRDCLTDGGARLGRCAGLTACPLCGCSSDSEDSEDEVGAQLLEVDKQLEKAQSERKLLKQRIREQRNRLAELKKK